MYRDHDGVGALAGVLLLLLFGGALAALAVGLLTLFRRNGRYGPLTATGPVTGHAPAPGWGADPGHAGYPGHPGPQPPHPMLAAEQTLADRLARGEIDVEDYEQRLAALRRSRPVPPTAPPAGPATGGPSSGMFGTPPPVAPPAPGTPPGPGTPPAD